MLCNVTGTGCLPYSFSLMEPVLAQTIFPNYTLYLYYPDLVSSARDAGDLGSERAAQLPRQCHTTPTTS